jgi:hypothetical protein
VGRLAYAAVFWLQIAKIPPPVFGNLSHIRDTSNSANGAQSQHLRLAEG